MTDKETAIVEPTVHPAVELLLARMKSNPDEFASSGHRWRKIVESYQPHFNDAEREALAEGMRAISMDAFHTAVMNELLREPEEENTKTPAGRSGINTAIENATPTTWGLVNTVPTPGRYYTNNQSAMQQAADMQRAYEQLAYVNPTTPVRAKRWGLF